MFLIGGSSLTARCMSETKKKKNNAGILLLMILGGLFVSAGVSALTVLILLSLMVFGTVVALLVEAFWVALILAVKKKAKEKRNISSLTSVLTLTGIPTVVWGIVFGVVLFLDEKGVFVQSTAAFANFRGLFWVIWSMAGIICSAIALISVILFCIVEYMRSQNTGRML